MEVPLEKEMNQEVASEVVEETVENTEETVENTEETVEEVVAASNRSNEAFKIITEKISDTDGLVKEVEMLQKKILSIEKYHKNNIFS